MIKLTLFTIVFSFYFHSYGQLMIDSLKGNWVLIDAKEDQTNVKFEFLPAETFYPADCPSETTDQVLGRLLTDIGDDKWKVNRFIACTRGDEVIALTLFEVCIANDAEVVYERGTMTLTFFDGEIRTFKKVK